MVVPVGVRGWIVWRGVFIFLPHGGNVVIIMAFDMQLES